ncbi:NADP-dependent isocitrate dehydrogenase, partial [Agrococcus casei]
RFASVSKALADGTEAIERELLDVQGQSVDLGGYYRVDSELTDGVMRPSTTLNGILASV